MGRDQKVEPFYSLIYSKEIGRAAQRLIGQGRRRPVLLRHPRVKMPSGEAGSAPTDSHQDISSLPFDRVGPLTIWVALNDMTARARHDAIPERISPDRQPRPHPRPGHGHCRVLPRPAPGVRDLGPDCAEAGDATVHMLRSSIGPPRTRTDERRWGYIMAYFPDDACTPERPTTTSTALGSRSTSRSTTSGSHACTRRSWTVRRSAPRSIRSRRRSESDGYAVDVGILRPIMDVIKGVP